MASIVFAAVSTVAPAAVDYFLKLPDVPGESTDAQHPDEIVILSYSWGVQGPTASGGGGAGVATFGDVVCVKEMDRASPELFNRLASGAVLPTATLVGRRAGAQPFEFMKIELENVMVTSIQSSGAAAGDVPTETLSLNYEKIRWTYVVQNPDGSAGDVIVRGWDLTTNTPYDAPAPTANTSAFGVK
jgi:type VI secretion system secreted protein Hcp